MGTFTGSYDQRSAMNSHRKKGGSRVQESPLPAVEVLGGDHSPKGRSSNKMRFEGDHNESLIGDFESMKE